MTSGPLASEHIGAFITDHKAAAQVQSKLAARTKKHSRLRFPEIRFYRILRDDSIRVVRTVVKAVPPGAVCLTEQLRYPLIEASQFHLGYHASGHGGLIRHNHDRNIVLVQSSNSGRGTWKQSYVLRTSDIVRAIFYDHSVPVEKHAGFH